MLRNFASHLTRLPFGVASAPALSSLQWTYLQGLALHVSLLMTCILITMVSEVRRNTCTILRRRLGNWCCTDMIYHYSDILSRHRPTDNRSILSASWRLHATEILWLLTWQRCLPIVSSPDRIFCARRKNGSGQLPIPFSFKVTGMQAHCSFLI